jgi:hypothetical protein
LKLRCPQDFVSSTGEVVDTGIIYKGTKKLFEDVADSGISESSVFSEVNEAGTSSTKVKEEKHSSSSDESSHRSQKKISRKRKLADDSQTATPAAKKIKSEPESSSDDEPPPRPKANIPRIDSATKVSSSKKEKKSLSQPTSPLKIKQEPKDELSDSAPRKDKKSKKKKKKRRDNEDDFESSLQILLEAQIKK